MRSSTPDNRWPVNGWIAISRQLLEHPIVGVRKGAPYSPTEAWIWLVLNASFERQIIYIRGQEIELNRGELVAAQSYLARAWRWTPDAVRWFLEKLVSTKSIVKKPTKDASHTQVIRLLQYERFQPVTPHNAHEQHRELGQEQGQQVNNKQPTRDSINARERAENGFWKKQLNPTMDGCELLDGALVVSDAVRQHWLPAFGGDQVRLQYALDEIAVSLQANSPKPIGSQVNSQLARIAGYKRERDQHRQQRQPAKSLGSVTSVVVRDTSESFSDYQARMVAEGKYRP